MKSMFQGPFQINLTMHPASRFVFLTRLPRLLCGHGCGAIQFGLRHRLAISESGTESGRPQNMGDVMSCCKCSGKTKQHILTTCLL